MSMSEYLEPDLKEKIAEIAINIVEKKYRGKFNDRNISKGNLRNLLNFVKNPAVGRRQFELFARYQAGKANRNDYTKFTEDLLKEINKLVGSEASLVRQNRIILELIKDIIMGMVYYYE